MRAAWRLTLPTQRTPKTLECIVEKKDLPDCQLPDLRLAAAITGFSQGTLRHWIYGSRPAPAGFPRPIKIGGKATRWRLADLQGWIEGLGVGAPPPQLELGPKPIPIASPERRHRPPGRGRPRTSARRQP